EVGLVPALVVVAMAGVNDVVGVLEPAGRAADAQARADAKTGVPLGRPLEHDEAPRSLIERGVGERARLGLGPDRRMADVLGPRRERGLEEGCPRPAFAGPEVRALRARRHALPPIRVPARGRDPADLVGEIGDETR